MVGGGGGGVRYWRSIPMTGPTLPSVLLPQREGGTSYGRQEGKGPVGWILEGGAGREGEGDRREASIKTNNLSHKNET